MRKAEMTSVLVCEFFEEEVFHEAGMFADCRYAVGLRWGETEKNLVRFCCTVFHAAGVN